MNNGFAVIDADRHVMEPSDLWDRYLEPEFKGRVRITGPFQSRRYIDGRSVSDSDQLPRDRTYDDEAMNAALFTEDPLYRSVFSDGVAHGFDPASNLRDMDRKGMTNAFRRAHEHEGSAFVEIYQNCNVFNDEAFVHFTEKSVKTDRQIVLEHGKPLLFGKNKDKGIRMNGLNLEVVTLGNGTTEKDLIVHDERHPNPAYAFLLSRMDSQPGFPTPLGVLRAVDAPAYETAMNEQLRQIVAKKGKGDIAKLLRAGDFWEVR